jgi:hypothetical protein
MSNRTRTYYTIHTQAKRNFADGDHWTWTISGSSPGGKTLEEAHARVRMEMNTIGVDRLDDVRFKIVKTVEVEEEVEIVAGSDAPFFMLKA